MPQIYYKRLVEGITVPAVIHNSNYYFIDMPVYEDGSFDCWNRKALDELADQLDKGWLVTAIPQGKTINIHGLGSYQINDAYWEYTPQRYVAYIHAEVQKMNRNMVNLFAVTAEQQERWSARRAGWGTHEIPYKLRGNFGYSQINGQSSSLFLRKGDAWQLATITAYADSTLQLDGSETILSLDDVRTLFQSGELQAEISGDFQLLIPGFAALTVTGEYQVATAEKKKEIEDMLMEVCGGKTVHQICQKAYYEYLVCPSESNRERLRTAYENVPEHQRMYLGDMDSKDHDYQRILYKPDRKREV